LFEIEQVITQEDREQRASSLWDLLISKTIKKRPFSEVLTKDSLPELQPTMEDLTAEVIKVK
jgi:hypothetical protein